MRSNALVMPNHLGRKCKNRVLSPSSRLSNCLSILALAAVLGSAPLAHAQDAQPFSFGDMLAANGGPLQLPLGITATATPITVGTGVAGGNHGDTNQSPASPGGNFPVGSTGFDEANRTVGLPIDTTRLDYDTSTTIDRGDTTGYADAIGFKVSFSSPIPADYFYALDIDFNQDNSEWKTSFGFNGTTYVAPVVSLSGDTRLQTVTEAVNNTDWAADIPLAAGQVLPANVELVSVLTDSGNAAPTDHRNQAIFDFGGQPLTDIYFLLGRKGVGSRSGGNSGLSALFLRVPEFDVGKGSSVSAVQPDGTVNLTYTVTVDNSGGVDFTGVAVEDLLTFPATIVSPPSIITPPTDPNSTAPTANAAYTGIAPNAGLLTTDSNVLAAGDSLQVEFTVNVAIADGPISNIAQTSGQPVGFEGSFADDGSDPDTDANGNPDTTPNIPGNAGISTSTNFPTANSSLSMTKVADSEGPHLVGDVVTYTYTVMNDGDVNVRDIAISDTHNGSDPAPTPGDEVLLTDAGTQNDSTDAAVDGSWDVLAPGDVLTFTGTYTITQSDVETL